MIAAGVLPEAGQVSLRGLQSGSQAKIDLQPAPARDQPPRDQHGRSRRLFVGELPKLVEPLDCQVFLGDAWIEPLSIQAMCLPVVEVQIEAIPPAYAAKRAGTVRMPKGMRQITVLEGSEVRLQLRSDKPLRAATIALDDAQHALHRRAADTAGAAEAAEEIWVLDSQGTPLASVVEPLRYAINVTDDEDQHLERPIEGMIRIQADSPPRIAAAAITTVVLPSAAPTIYYRALDDHALGRIWLSYEITRSGKTEPGEPDTTTGEVKITTCAGREERNRTSTAISASTWRNSNWAGQAAQRRHDYGRPACVRLSRRTGAQDRLLRSFALPCHRRAGCPQQPLGGRSAVRAAS